MNITEVLSNTLSQDQRIREAATAHLESAAKENFSGYLLVLSQELIRPDSAPHVKSAAGLALKNSLLAKDFQRREELAHNWLSVDSNIRQQIKASALQSLASQDSGASGGQVIAAIAAIELPLGEWPQMIETILTNVTGSSNNKLRQMTLQALGYVCETIEPQVLANHSDPILTAVVSGARKEETDSSVRLAALYALYNSLEFIKENFDKEGERNFIMQVVCEATQSENVEIQVASYEILVRLMQLYYDKMSLYMQKALYGLTISGMKSSEEQVALQAVEFWSTVCEEEIELAYEIEEATANNEAPSVTCFNFAKAALNDIVPVLLWLLTQQDEDADDEDWNIAMAAGTCLGLFANCVPDGIVLPVLPFIEENIRNPDWHHREAAVMAFGSIVEGPQPHVISPLITQALPVLMGMMKDPVVHVKDTVAWTLGRVCEVQIDCVKLDVHLPNLVSALLEGLNDSPKIISNCSWAIMNMAEQLVEDNTERNSPLSPYYEALLSTLMRISDRQDNEHNSRTSSYEAISTLITQATLDDMAIVEKCTVAILDRLEALVSSQAHEELQGNLCSVITSIIRKVETGISAFADRIMQALLTLLSTSSKQSVILEDAFLAIGAIAQALNENFERYLGAFTPFLYNALQNHAEHQLCSIAIGIVGDICRSLNTKVQPYCHDFMNLLLQDLQSNNLHRDLRPVILSCFGDIALAIGEAFETYYAVVSNVLQQASQVKAAMNNYDMIEYVNQLRDGIIVAYVGIVQGFKGTDKVQLLMPSIQAVFQFLHVAYNDTERTETVLRGLIGLIGDFAECFPNGELKPILCQDWVEQAINEGRRGRNISYATKDIAKWAKDRVKKATA